MAYNFGLLTAQGMLKARQWLKAGYGVLSNGKPPVDDAVDNNYQNYSDNAAGTGAIASFKALNASSQFEVTAGHTLIDNALTLNAVAVPATPTVAFTGTAGSTTYTYKVVGRAGSLQAPSATVSTTTANATLSAANFNTLTFTPTPGFLVFDIYRTAGGSTQGMIGTVVAALGPNVSTPTLTFADTGLVADGSTAPTANTTGAITGDLAMYGNLTVNALVTPHAPLVTPQGVVGVSTWGYKVVARSGSPVTPTGHSAVSSAGTTTTGNATLTSANRNLISWQSVPGAVSYDVYRTSSATSPTTTGLIGNTTGRTFTDTGIAGDSSSAPTTNTTGVTSFGAASPQFPVVANYIATENGANNAIASAAASGPALTTGLVVFVKLAHSLQAGANTFAYNGGATAAIKQNTNPATDIATAYVSGGTIELFYDGTVWQELS